MVSRRRAHGVRSRRGRQFVEDPQHPVAAFDRVVDDESEVRGVLEDHGAARAGSWIGMRVREFRRATTLPLIAGADDADEDLGGLQVAGEVRRR